MYDEITKLNELMNFAVVLAVAMIGAAVRTSMVLRDRKKIVNTSWILFVTDQIMGIATGFIAYAIITQWFCDYNYLVKLAAIGGAAGSANELMAVAKVGLVDGFRGWIGRMLGAVGQVEQKIEKTENEVKNEIK